MERQLAGRMLLQQVEHRFAFCQHLVAVALGRGIVVADIGEQFGLVIGQRVCSDMIWICLRVAICCNSTNSVNRRPTETASPTGNCARRPSAT